MRLLATTTATSAGRRSAAIEPRAVGPALLVLALAVLMSVVLPAIDSATSYRDQVDAGDVAQIADGLTFVPTPGWDLATGALVGHTRSPVGTTATTEVVDGSVELQVQTAPFDGTPSALLTRVNKIDADSRLVHRPPKVPARKRRGAGLMLTAMLMHGLWNASSAIGGDSAFGWIVPITVASVLIAVFVWVYETTVPVEREWMRELLAPEVRLGVVAPAELDALAGPRSTLKRYLRTQPSRRRAEQVLDAERKLAHQIAHDGGAETAAVGQARAAVTQARVTE